MKKEKYSDPEMDLIKFTAADVLTTSGEDDGGNDSGEGGI